MDLRSTLLAALDAHCAATGQAPATVATKIVNDGKFFARVKAGAGFTVRRYEQAMAWFEAERQRRERAADPAPANDSPEQAA